MYETLRSKVLKQDWYRAAPGYLANIVAYAISRFALQVSAQFGGARYDFSRVWQSQRISDSTLDALDGIAHAAQRHLTDPGRPQANVTQWAKQQACWEGFKKVRIRLETSVEGDLVPLEEARIQATDDRKQRAMDTGFEAVKRVLAVKPGVWETVYRSTPEVPVTPTEKDLVQLFGLREGKVPSDRQAALLLRLLGRMADSGVISRDAY